jgi:serine/threonine-protein kinase
MPAQIGPGTVLAGKYRVERVLGEGGMGIVVAARHTQLDQRVAVKFMRTEALGQGDGIDRFLREARAAARLEGEHVVRVTDIGTLDDGAPYIVMEYLDGRDLGSVLAERGRIPVAEAAHYVIEACEAMTEAHAQGIVHRDLKPENLFLARRPGRRPIVKVLDFGISKLLENSDALSSTRTSVMMGSPAYMSPEQMQSPKYVDGRTDLWSLGVILYQLTSGKLPYYAESVLMLSALVLTQEPPPLLHVAPDIPPAFANVVHRCLTRDLTQRFQTADELAEALSQAVAGLPAPRLTSDAVGLRTPTAGLPRTSMAAPAAGAEVHAPAGSSTPGPMLLAPSGPVSVQAETVRHTPVPAAVASSTIGPPAKRRLVVPALAAITIVGGIVAFAVIKAGGSDDAEPATPAPAVEPIGETPPAPPTPTPAPAPPDPATATMTTPDAAVAPAVPDPDPAVTSPDPDPVVKKKPPKRPKRPKEKPDDDPFGTLQ